MPEQPLGSLEVSALTVRIGHVEDRLPLLQQRPDQVWRVGVIYQGRALGRERRLKNRTGEARTK